MNRRIQPGAPGHTARIFNLPQREAPPAQREAGLHEGTKNMLYCGLRHPRPPSTPSTCPVMNALLGFMRNSSAAATSSASPTRLSACIDSDTCVQVGPVHSCFTEEGMGCCVHHSPPPYRATTIRLGEAATWLTVRWN
eukprot:365444-Chlamydomonas_euryale.AAC.2